MMRHSIDIPPLLHCPNTHGLLRQCLLCEEDLLESNQPYLIEKAFVQPLSTAQTQTLFAYAICMNCATTMRQQMSRESLAKLESFMQAGVEKDHRLLPEEFTSPQQIDQWFDHCAFTGTPIEELTEYQVIAICQGDQLLLTNDPSEQRLPLIIGGEILEQITELLSTETRETLDRFGDLLSGIPPEWEELFGRKPILL